MVEIYVKLILLGKKSMEDVPDELKIQVKDKLSIILEGCR